MKYIVASILMMLCGLSCAITEERFEDPTVFKNEIPTGGPAIKVENHTMGSSYEEILKWLVKDRYKDKFCKSLAWLQMETKTDIHELEGLTAHQLIDFANALKKKMYNNYQYEKRPCEHPLPHAVQ